MGKIKPSFHEFKQQIVEVFSQPLSSKASFVARDFWDNWSELYDGIMHGSIGINCDVLRLSLFFPEFGKYHKWRTIGAYIFLAGLLIGFHKWMIGIPIIALGIGLRYFGNVVKARESRKFAEKLVLDVEQEHNFKGMARLCAYYVGGFIQLGSEKGRFFWPKIPSCVITGRDDMVPTTISDEEETDDIITPSQKMPDNRKGIREKTKTSLSSEDREYTILIISKESPVISKLKNELTKLSKHEVIHKATDKDAFENIITVNADLIILNPIIISELIVQESIDHIKEFIAACKLIYPELPIELFIEDQYKAYPDCLVEGVDGYIYEDYIPNVLKDALNKMQNGKGTSHYNDMVSGITYGESWHEQSLVILHDIDLKGQDNHYVQYYLGRIYFGKAMKDQALEHFLKSSTLNQYGLNEEVYFYLGNIYDDYGMYEEAIEAYDDAVSINPDFAKGYNGRGLVYEQLDMTQDAIESFKEACRCRSDSAWYCYNLGINYYKANMFEEAIDTYKRALDIELNRIDIVQMKGGCALYADIKYSLGRIHDKLGNYNESIDCYKEVLRISPDNTGALNNLGTAYLELRLYQNALDAFKSAVEMKPDYARAHYNLGVTYKKLGDIDLAMNEYNILKSLDAKFANQLYNIIH